MPVVSGMMHAFITVPDDAKTRKRAEKIQLMNNSLFLKAEFAKLAYRTIEGCYSKYGELLDDGNYLVRPVEMMPAWREVDNLIFELGSILDFFSREVNIAFDLGISLRSVSFSVVVRKCLKLIPDEPITKSLIDFSESKFHKYFRGMRNRITHRLPFVFRGMNDQIFFPDDPDDDEVDPKTELGIDVGITCKEWLYGILEFVDRTSLQIFQKIAKIQAISKITGKELTMEEYIENHRRELEEKLRSTQ